MPEPCDCPDSGRRTFLGQVTTALAAIMAGFSASPRDAAAMPIALIRPLGRDGRDLIYPEPTADGAVVDAEQEVILVRWQGSIYAFNLSCPHQNTALKWAEGAHIFRCPRHKSEYQPDGTFVRGRATRGMDRFAIRKSGASVVVSVDTLYRDDRDHGAWAAAMVPV